MSITSMSVLKSEHVGFLKNIFSLKMYENKHRHTHTRRSESGHSVPVEVGHPLPQPPRYINKLALPSIRLNLGLKI